MPKQKKNNGLIKTKKSGVLKGVGKYTKGRPRVTNRVRGRGGFFEDAGSKVGSWLGNKAGGFLSKIFGIGSYAVTKNSLVSQASDPPVLSNTRGATRIQHREYITDISGSTGFSIASYPINPGMSSTFPWLASVASCFEEYIFHGILFEFKSTSASALNSTNTALGTVIMATEYNALHLPFVSKRDMENYVYSTSSPPDRSGLHPVECARDINVLNELYVRNSPPAQVSDLRFSDLGNFQIATVGMQAAANIGELWVTYDIELIKPKLPDNLNSIAIAHYLYDVVSNPSVPVPSAAQPFGTLGGSFVLKGVGLSPVTLGAGGLMTFTTSSRYILIANYAMGSSGLVSPFGSGVLGTGVTPAPIFSNGVGGLTSTLFSPIAGATAFSVTNIWAFDVNVGNNLVPTVQFTASSFANTIVAANWLIVPVPQGFNFPVPLTMSDLSTRLDNLMANFTRFLEVEADSKEEVVFVKTTPSHRTCDDPSLDRRMNEHEKTNLFLKMGLST